MKSHLVNDCWSIGHYAGDSSICVNYKVDGEIIHHRHDYGGEKSRALRLGEAIEEIEREIQKDKQRQVLVDQIIEEIKPSVIEAFKLIKVKCKR